MIELNKYTFVLLSIKSCLERIICKINENKSYLHRGKYIYINCFLEDVIETENVKCRKARLYGVS